VGTDGSMSWVVGLPNNSYKPITRRMVIMVRYVDYHPSKVPIGGNSLVTNHYCELMCRYHLSVQFFSHSHNTLRNKYIFIYFHV
jgi:hypothetical protein